MERFYGALSGLFNIEGDALCLVTCLIHLLHVCVPICGSNRSFLQWLAQTISKGWVENLYQESESDEDFVLALAEGLGIRNTFCGVSPHVRIPLALHAGPHLHNIIIDQIEDWLTVLFSLSYLASNVGFEVSVMIINTVRAEGVVIEHNQYWASTFSTRHHVVYQHV